MKKFVRIIDNSRDDWEQKINRCITFEYSRNNFLQDIKFCGTYHHSTGYIGMAFLIFCSSTDENKKAAV